MADRLVILARHLHCDPADRIVVATARKFDLRLVTRDRRIFDYAEQGYVRHGLLNEWG